MAASAGIYTLGCRVNQYESEALAEKLSDIGVIVKDFSEKNDIYIINTCTPHTHRKWEWIAEMRNPFGSILAAIPRHNAGYFRQRSGNQDWSLGFFQYFPKRCYTKRNLACRPRPKPVYDTPKELVGRCLVRQWNPCYLNCPINQYIIDRLFDSPGMIHGHHMNIVSCLSQCRSKSCAAKRFCVAHWRKIITEYYKIHTHPIL